MPLMSLPAFAERSRRAERRIAKFISKNQIAGQQDWAAPWISFKAIAEYCAALRTPRKSVAGEQGKKFAYDELIQAMTRGAFGVNGRSRVLLLVSHGGKVLSVTSDELLEVREAFDPKTFARYLNHCWSRAGLIAVWFRRSGIPAPWGPAPRPTLSIPRKRPSGSVNHEGDVTIIDNAIEIIARKGLSQRAAMKAAISEFNLKAARNGEMAREGAAGTDCHGRVRSDHTGSETDRLRTKMRKRQKLRQINKSR